MQVTNKGAAASRGRLAFLLVALCALAACVMLATSNAAMAAPESSSSAASAATGTAASSSSAAAAADAAEEAATDEIVEASSLPVAFGNDLLLAGDAVEANGETVKANLIAAGNRVDINQSKVGADVFAAGSEISIANVTATSNLFLAGNNITVAGTTGQTLFAAGNNLDIAADVKDLNAAGRTIFLKGTFEGTVNVTAQNVVIDPYIVVKGTLNVQAEQEPTIASTAKIANYNFTQAEFDDGLDISKGFANIGSQAWIEDLVKTLLALLVTAILMLLVLRTEVVDATGLLVRNRPVAILVTGLLSLILVPVLCFGLFLSIVGVPAGFVICLIFFGMTVLSVVYTAVALGRAALIRVNKWVTTILFVAVFGLLMSLPVVDFIVLVLCIIFTTGSLVQGWWVWRRGKKLDTGDGDGFDSSEFTVPRGTHYADPVYANAQGQAPVTRPLSPSGMPQGTGAQQPVPPSNPVA